ncbi:MAG: EAL domain-containing protein [Chloroflexota bacterium]
MALVLVLAVAVAETVATHLTRTAIDEAVAATETIVRGDMDELLTPAAMAGTDTAAAAGIDARLARLMATGQLLRIKVWRPDGTIAYSDKPELRGAAFAPSDELEEALDGETASEMTVPSADENLFERDLAHTVLEVYLPLRDPATGAVMGAYEVYRSADGIVADIASTRQDALLLVGGAGAVLLLLLTLGFSGSSRILGRQNRLLRARSAALEALATDLRRSEERFRSLIQSSADIIAVLDADGRVRSVSPAVERLVGLPPERCVGRPITDLVHASDLAAAERLLLGIQGTPRAQAKAELRVAHTTSGWRVIDAIATNRLDDPAVAGIVLNAHDVTDRKRLEQELTTQAFRDRLTGLANRALFLDRLGHALTREQRGHGLALLYLDLDDFKAVNDLRGHSVGDRLLVSVGERIRSVLREMDSVARLGGDEFAVIIEDADDATTPADIAERILAALRRPFLMTLEDGTVTDALHVRASVGIAGATPGIGADELLRDADIAMYLAKGAGGDRYALFDATMSAEAMDRLQLKSELAGASARGELSVVYQPIVDLAAGRVTGMEALMRWNHPIRGAVPPAEFIPLAEQSGAIVELGRWVLDEACSHLAGLGDEAAGMSVSVNVSGRQLGDDGLVDHVRAALLRTGLEPRRLVLEMTESVMIRDLDSGLRTLTRLRALGVRLAIDDFGTGYSSLSYLARLPVDALKIDRSFVTALRHADSAGTLVRSIVEMGRSLGLSCVAEGIEDPADLALLRDMGAAMGQGYLLARPMPIERMRWYLRGRHAGAPSSVAPTQGR